MKLLYNTDYRTGKWFIALRRGTFKADLRSSFLYSACDSVYVCVMDASLLELIKSWRREWPGQVFLSHKQSNCAEVGILFSKAFSPHSVELHHVMAGYVLMVKAFYKNVKMVFLCVYAPVLSMNRMTFLNALCDGGVSDEYLFLGGDYNCTADAALDRNHLEPHPASSARLKHLIETHDLKDVWRGFNGRNRQYTWSHCIFTVSNIILVFLKAAISSWWVCRITPWFSAAFLCRM